MTTPGISDSRNSCLTLSLWDLISSQEAKKSLRDRISVDGGKLRPGTPGGSLGVCGAVAVGGAKTGRAFEVTRRGGLSVRDGHPRAPVRREQAGIPALRLSWPAVVLAGGVLLSLAANLD
jgi:hypothetical protein